MSRTDPVRIGVRQQPDTATSWARSTLDRWTSILVVPRIAEGWMTNHTPAHQFRHLIDGGSSVPGDEERPPPVAHTGTLIRAIPPQLSFEHGAGNRYNCSTDSPSLTGSNISTMNEPSSVGGSEISIFRAKGNTRSSATRRSTTTPFGSPRRWCTSHRAYGPIGFHFHYTIDPWKSYRRGTVRRRSRTSRRELPERDPRNCRIPRGPGGESFRRLRPADARNGDRLAAMIQLHHR
jgi:hypothetical protein